VHYIYTMHEVHPFGEFIPGGAKCLILGTFPTHKKNWRFNSFYPGRNNFFWRLLSDVYHVKFQHTIGEEAVKERLALCTEKGIAITDTIRIAKRKILTSSKDTDLIVIEKTDILGILRRHPSIDTVILTGSSGPVSAHHLFYGHLLENKVPFMVSGSKPPIHGSFVLEVNTISVHSLYSTSGINIGRYAQAVEQYRECLPNV
jgi:G:T/U-mismatch repair DNA glycosylase